MTETTLILFCKRPAPGFGKQRLAAEIGTELAFEIAKGLLACALEDAQRWPGSVVISPNSPEEAVWAEGLLTREYEVVPQSEGNLGERIESIDHQLRHRGLHRQIVIGSDAPELSMELLLAADRLLDEADVVFSAAEDGGVSLMGTRSGWPALKEMPWSTKTLGQALATGCECNQQSVDWVADCSDVDRLMDLQRIHDALRDDSRPARQALRRLVGQVLGKS